MRCVQSDDLTPLQQAAIKLLNELSGLDIVDHVREAWGNTNAAVLQLRIDELFKALSDAKSGSKPDA